MSRQTIAMVSLGCAKNRVDSETMLSLLELAGYERTDDAAQADAIIVNTCSFIEPAQQEAVDTILEMAQYKSAGRCRALIVAGCMAQMFQDQLREQLPEVDAVIGTGSYDQVCRAVELALTGQSFEHYASIDEQVLFGPDRVLSTPVHSAYLKIAEGCNNHCAYCAIPSLRGKYRSRPIEEIVEEANRLAGRGVKELILLAQDTACYGIDRYREYALARLLRALCRVDGIRWIRTHYLYPSKLPEELLAAFEQEEKLVPYFDLPLQHSESRLLQAMHRQGDGELVRAVCRQIKERFPKGALRTSMIVGFPGETEAEFEALCSFVKEVRFDRMGVFCYSRQEGTPAYDLPGQIPEEEKERRRDVLMAIQQQISLENNRARLGDVLPVLCEGMTPEGLYYGRSELDSLEVDGTVYFGAELELAPGDFVAVQILDCDAYDLYGQAVGGIL